MSKYIACILIFLFLLSPVFAQDLTPEPYDPDEFPLWIREVRRTEAILFGLLPLTIFYATIGYDIYRYSNYAIENGKTESDYLPSMLTSTHAPFTKTDQQYIIWTAMGIAATAAIVDLIIYLVRDKRQR